MFWKRKEKKNDSQSKVVPNKKIVPQPDLLERLSRSNPPPRPPVVYVPPPPPSDSPEEEPSVEPVSEAEPPPQPSQEELTSWRQRGALMVMNREFDAGVSLLLDVLRYIPGDPESLIWINMALSGDGKLHISPMNMRRIEEFRPAEKVKAQILVKR